MHDGLNVSREAIDRLRHYESLLRKWNPAINLVAKSTLDDLWKRHIIDSAQIFEHAPEKAEHWLDIGTGGGFPGVVISIMAAETGNPAKVSMIESDTRKATFLRTVLRETGVTAKVIADRIENVPSQNADVLSARALTDLTGLLDHAKRHLKPEGVALFHKGAKWENELKDAQTKWHFHHQVVKSRTGDGPVILRISGVSRV